MYPCDLSHKQYVRLVLASKVFHNICVIHKDDIVQFDVGTDAEWQEFFKTFARDACPTCVRLNKPHCPHTAGNRNVACPLRGRPSEQRDAIKHQLWEALCDEERDRVTKRARVGQYLGN